MKPAIRWIVILICVIIIAYGIFKPREYKYQFDNKDAAMGKINDLEGTIAKLIDCESGGNPKAYHAKDGDGTDSVGILQFKWLTFEQYARKLNVFPHAEAAELKNIWTDPDAQINLAKEMIKSNRNNLRHWLICSKKNGLL